MTKRGNENKPHIGIFGRCNVGKSTLLNFISGEYAAIVSPHSGTTTDPVRRSMEILDFAPVVIIDTAGIDDQTDLGEERKSKTFDSLYNVDLAIVVYNGLWGQWEQQLVDKIDEQSIPYIVICNLVDEVGFSLNKRIIKINLYKNAQEEYRNSILDLIKLTLPEYSYAVPSMFGDAVEEGDVVILVCPIDSEAPAGRLILPQIQAIRDLLDKYSISIVVQEQQLSQALELCSNKVKLVVTDSQIVDRVNKIVSGRCNITTFSIVLAAMKGDMELYKKGLKKVDSLCDGDKILILESCTHQSSCEDIGRVKIPMWLKSYTGKDLSFDFVTKLSSLPCDLDQYALAVQCGGCMVTRRQLQGRINRVAASGVDITNYGMLIRKIK